MRLFLGDSNWWNTVDGSEIWLNQLRLVVYPIIYKVLYIPGGCLGFLPLTVSIKYDNMINFAWISWDDPPSVVNPCSSGLFVKCLMSFQSRIYWILDHQCETTNWPFPTTLQALPVYFLTLPLTRVTTMHLIYPCRWGMDMFMFFHFVEWSFFRDRLVFWIIFNEIHPGSFK